MAAIDSTSEERLDELAAGFDGVRKRVAKLDPPGGAQEHHAAVLELLATSATELEALGHGLRIEDPERQSTFTQSLARHLGELAEAERGLLGDGDLAGYHEATAPLLRLAMDAVGWSSAESVYRLSAGFEDAERQVSGLDAPGDAEDEQAAVVDALSGSAGATVVLGNALRDEDPERRRRYTRLVARESKRLAAAEKALLTALD
jgi:hypothetical protein